MEHPKISIITPSFNQAQFLEKTILSVLNQNYPNLEYIIIDGGSTDGSVDIIKKYEDHLTYWVSEPDKGTYDANNKGLEKMTGDWWCVVNSDDLLLPNALYTLAKRIEQFPEQKWFAGGVKYIDQDGKEIGEHMPEIPQSIRGYTFLNGCWISHPTVFIHKSITSEVGVFEPFHLLDMNYWLRLEEKGYFPHIIKSHIAYLRLHQDCKSYDLVKLQKEYCKVFDSFIHKIGIVKDSKIIKKNKENVLYLLKLQLSHSIVKKDRIFSFKCLIRIAFLNPLSFFSIWYLGAIKRFLLGVKENDPLLKFYFVNDSQANWNPLD